MEDRENVPGTIENTRKMLAYLRTIDRPSVTARMLIQRYQAEVDAYEYGNRRMREITGPVVEPPHEHDLHRWEDEGGPVHPDSFHDVAGANV